MKYALKTAAIVLAAAIIIVASNGTAMAGIENIVWGT